MNFTIELPSGTTNHGDPHLICTPANWRDFFIFYVTNYFIHAATLPASPGESKRETVFAVLNALLIPGFGTLRAMRRLVLFPGLRRELSPVERAAASGALCMVVSDHGQPNWFLETFSESPDLSNLGIPLMRKIHGVCKLPKGYSLFAVPPNVKLHYGEPSESDPKFEVSSEYNVVKVLFSLVQIVAGSITIYRARGDQITQYGYGAFGLSAVPYVLMSAVNIIASLLGPTYSSMYLIRTPDMNQAEEMGGKFSGVIADLVPREGNQQAIQPGFWKDRWCTCGIIWIL